MTHATDELFAELPSVEPYPEGVVPTNGCIPGVAFFPGGRGLWHRPSTPMPAMPVGGVMIVGQDFDTYASFNASLARGGEVLIDEKEQAKSLSATWRTLIDLLPRQFGIPLGRCFFTNAYMGLRKDGPPTGCFIGSNDPDFAARCRVFFRNQLVAQRPRLILSLGVWVPSFIAPLSASLSDWTGLNSFAELDDVGPVRHCVAFTGTPVEAASVVCLTHPSLRGPNVRRRRYRGLVHTTPNIRWSRTPSPSRGSISVLLSGR